MGDIGAMTGFGGAGDTPTGLMDIYNQYTDAQNKEADFSAFAHSGIPVGTGVNFATAGADANEVYQTTRESDAMRAANQQVANAQKGALSSGIGAIGSLAGAFGGI